jgi:hypothetical protein
VAGTQRFEPVRVSASKLCGPANGGSSAEWSGNFLNWGSMSRMDAVRKILYGGLRSTDQTPAQAPGGNPNLAATVLERAYLPTDAHAWAKHYDPTVNPSADKPPLDQLTPFAPNPAAASYLATTNTFVIPAADASPPDYVMVFTTNQSSRFRIGDQLRIERSVNDKHFFVANPIDRHAIGDRDKLNFNPDGSLDIYLQRDNPGKDKESNWLPAPKESFNVILRIYWPKQDLLERRWTPPGIQRAT